MTLRLRLKFQVRSLTINSHRGDILRFHNSRALIEKRDKTFNKRKNHALLTVRRSQKRYEIFSNNVFRKNITRKQLRLETIEIA